jgi:quercetin dioxygenase-like cupin family protein
MATLGATDSRRIGVKIPEDVFDIILRGSGRAAAMSRAQTPDAREKIGSAVRNAMLKEIRMLVNKAADREWKPTDYPGIERSLFRTNDTGGRASIVRMAQGSRFPRHAHEGSEEVVVMTGIVRIGGVELRQGDYLFTGAGEEHDVVAVSDAAIFVSSQKATPVVE